MNPDDEFDDFLRRRRPLFDRPPDDDLEPPQELDRLVLRQAREAIEPAPSQRIFRAPRWGMPVALAATLVLAFSVILHTAKQPNVAEPQVAVKTVARELNTPAEAPGAPAAAAAPIAAERGLTETPAAPRAGNSIVVDLNDPRVEEQASVAREQSAPGVEAFAKQSRERDFVSDAEARRHAAPPPSIVASSPPAPSDAASAAKAERADAFAAPAWRSDAKTWMAEIERLRTAGDHARADAELAEYKRQHRAYATSPDQ